MRKEIVSTKQFFEKHHIVLSDEWLESCIQWYREENPNLNYTLETLHLKVYEQWLLLDLRDVELSILPLNISQQKKMVLDGKFSLQMMYVKDIAHPMLWQLQNLRNKKVLSAVFDQENDTNNRVKRMLQLVLTDGVQEIEAIEYKPISSLHINLSPGIKIRIVGPVTVRRGQLMLEEKNVVVLGGEVEELLIPNAAENILARALNLPLNPNPYNIEEEPNNPETDDIDTNQNVAQQQNGINSDTEDLRSLKLDCNSRVVTSKDISTNLESNYSSNGITNTNQNSNKVFHPQPSSSELNNDNIFEDEEILLMNEMDMLLEIEQEFARNAVQQTTDVTSTQTTPYTVTYENNPSSCDTCDIFEEIDIDAHLDLVDEQIKRDEKNKSSIISISEFKSKSNMANKSCSIKARFKSVIKKLTVANNLWSLKILVEDDDDDIEVFIHSNVVTNLIGYEPSAMLALKSNILSKDESTTTNVKKAIESLKEKITSLDCVMDLEFDESKDCPFIMNLK